MYIDPALLGPVSALMGALIGGSTSFVAAVYTQRHQDRLQRVASEVAKRETVYADFVMSASNFLLNGHCQVASSGRVMGKTSNAGVRLQAQVRQHRATCRTRHFEPYDTGWH